VKPPAGASDRDAWLLLAAVTGVGPRTCGALVRSFGTPARAVAAAAGPRGVDRLAAVPGVTRARAAAVVDALARADPAAMDREARAAGLFLLTPVDADYPAALAGSCDPPPAVWGRGTLPPADRPAVAVVGTRGASPYGLRVAHALGKALARAGLVVVSGLARGIDGAAHAGALAGGGPTVGVLGCGVDVVYPPEHAALAGEIAACGALLSEHPPRTSPHPGHFPRRNRIVAALSRAVIVVEAPLDSGALVTARLAADLGRDVLAVPGPVDRGTHAGCHRLLRDGARLCEGIQDVLLLLRGEELPPLDGSGDGPSLFAALPTRTPPPDGPALVLWNALDPDDARDFDDLAARTGLSPDVVAIALTHLELEGYAHRVPGLGFRRVL